MKSKNSLDYALLFCGGKGTRLGKIGNKINKSMLLINKKPIIFYIVSNLIKSKIKKIIFPLGYKGETIENYLRKKFPEEINRFIFLKTGLNSSLAKRVNVVKKKIDKNKKIIILNGDTLLNFNTIKIMQKYNYNNSKPIVCIFNKKIDLGFIFKENKSYKFIKNSFINQFKHQKTNFYSYSGIIILNSNIILNLKMSGNENFEETLFKKTLKKNFIIHDLKNRCFPIDSIKDLEYAKKNFNKILSFK